jgi:hypothetical protein
LTFGEVNDVGSTHRLPAVVLASVCGYSADTATYELRAEQLREAAAPFMAFYATDLGDKSVSAHDIAFRARLSQ